MIAAGMCMALVSLGMSLSMGVAAPGPVGPTGPLRGTNWSTATGYHCQNGSQKVLLDKVVYGDINSDGVEDAVVSLRCDTTTSTNPVNVEAFDGASNPARPRSLGVLLPAADPIYVKTVDISIGRGAVSLTGHALGKNAPLAADPSVTFNQLFNLENGTLKAQPRQFR